MLRMHHLLFAGEAPTASMRPSCSARTSSVTSAVAVSHPLRVQHACMPCGFETISRHVAVPQGYAQDTTKAGSNSAPATGENLQAAARDHGGPISGADMAARGATNAAAAATKVQDCPVSDGHPFQ